MIEDDTIVSEFPAYDTSNERVYNAVGKAQEALDIARRLRDTRASLLGFQAAHGMVDDELAGEVRDLCAVVNAAIQVKTELEWNL